jgi:hypothetical protein
VSGHAATLAYAVSAGAYAGFQLTIRFVVYPQFARVPSQAFPPYERAHQRAVTPVVGVLFGALAVTSVLVVASGSRGPGVVAPALLAALLLVTALGAVPQHRVLDDGFDVRAHRRLLAWDTARVVLALAQVVVGAVVVGLSW